MREGAERAVLQAVSNGTLSLGKAVELLGITHWDVYALVHQLPPNMWRDQAELV